MDVAMMAAGWCSVKHTCISSHSLLRGRVQIYELQPIGLILDGVGKQTRSDTSRATAHVLDWYHHLAFHNQRLHDKQRTRQTLHAAGIKQADRHTTGSTRICPSGHTISLCEACSMARALLAGFWGTIVGVS